MQFNNKSDNAISDVGFGKYLTMIIYYAKNITFLYLHSCHIIGKLHQ